MTGKKVVATPNAPKSANARKTLSEEHFEIVRELINLQGTPTDEDEDDDSTEFSKFNFNL